MKNQNNYLSKAITLLLTLALLVGMVSTSAMAAAYTVADGDANATITMNKYLLMDANATVPTVTFGFTIAPGSTTPATITINGKTQKIIAGVLGGSIDDAAFGPSATGMTEVTGTVGADDVADIGATMPTGKKYAKQTTTISLVGMVFPTPGVYRYTISENDTTAPGVTKDATTRVLDVYVGYANEDAEKTQTMSILGTVLHNGAGDVAGGTDTKEYQGKKKGLTNTFTTHDLTLKKLVTGNQGYHDQEFTFSVKIDGTGIAGNFKMTKTGATDTTITAKTETTVTLKHDQTITIYGLPAGATYTIVEEKNNCADYTTTITDDNGATVTAASATVVGEMKNATANVVYTNNREGVVPTGILLDIWPYVLLVAVAAVALIVLMSSKRKYAAR